MADERVIAPSEMSELFAAAVGILTIPRIVTKVDALVVFPGMGEQVRVREAQRHWEEICPSARFWLIAGSNPEEKHFQAFTGEFLTSSYGLKRTSGLIVQRQDEGRNAKLQSTWVAEKVRELGIQSLALFVSEYHMVRAFMTLLKALGLKGFSGNIIVPMPIAQFPSQIIPEADSVMWDLFAGEADRILRYQKAGNVATFEDLRRYIDFILGYGEFQDRIPRI